MTSEPNKLITKLAQDARAMEARMLPTDSPLNQEHHDMVRSHVADFVGRTGMKMRALELKVKVPKGAILHYCMGTYAGEVDDLARRVFRWISQNDRDARVGKPLGLVSTTVADTIHGVFDQVHRLTSMAAIIGPGGVGKTMVARSLLEQGTFSGVYVPLASVDCSKSALINTIADTLGGPTRYRMQQSFRWIVKHLRETGAMLVLDECGYIKKDAANVVRDIHKQAEVPVVLIGTQDLLDTINDFTSYHGQLTSLFSFVYNITEEVSQSGDPLFTMEDINKYTKAMGLKLTADGRAKAFDITNALGWGGLRKLSMVLLNAHALATLEAEEAGKEAANPFVHARHIDMALREMDGASGFERVHLRLNDQPRKVKTA